MPWHRRKGPHWMGLGLVLVAIVAGSGCRSAPEAVTEASTPTTTGDSTEASNPLEETIAGFRATVIDPPRLTMLATQQAGAQINLRSQPTTLSPIVGNGQSGDEIRLLRLAEGEEGYSWYYVQFTQTDSEGWVRGDFVDTANATAAPAPNQSAAAQPVVATSTQPCGSDRQEAHFETQSFSIYVCSTARGLRYIGTDKASQAALEIEDVGETQGTYIAIDGNQQYHINDKSLAIYEVTNGNYSQLKGEPVLRFERFIY